MKKKIHLKFIHLFFFSAMLILVGCTQQIRKNDKLESQKLSYQVSSESLDKVDNIGTYMIEYDIDMKKIIETKDYTLNSNGETFNVYNLKEYIFDNNNRLINYKEQEDYNSEEKLNLNTHIDYDVNSKQVISTSESPFSTNKSVTYLPLNEVDIAVSNSCVLSLPFKEIEVGEKTFWFCYDISGFVDRYEYLGKDPITATSGEEIECRKIKHIGIFNTTYWLNENNQIVRIEQIMDKNYTLIFNLASN